MRGDRRYQSRTLHPHHAPAPCPGFFRGAHRKLVIKSSERRAATASWMRSRWGASVASDRVRQANPSLCCGQDVECAPRSGHDYAAVLTVACRCGVGGQLGRQPPWSDHESALSDRRLFGTPPFVGCFFVGYERAIMFRNRILPAVLLALSVSLASAAEARKKWRWWHHYDHSYSDRFGNDYSRRARAAERPEHTRASIRPAAFRAAIDRIVRGCSQQAVELVTGRSTGLQGPSSPATHSASRSRRCAALSLRQRSDFLPNARAMPPRSLWRGLMRWSKQSVQ